MIDGIEPLVLLSSFAFYYPLVMAYTWIVGALCYFYRYEYRQNSVDNPPPLSCYPRVSVIVPCYNESKNVVETIEASLAIKYPNFEVIAVNDGSSDETGNILDALAAIHRPLKVIHHATNQGKAVALRSGALMADSEYLLGIDGDALPDPWCLRWMMMHFLQSPRVAAVTGNPRVRTRTTLLGRIQVGEFSAILGLIKRAQRIYGRVFTVSGVISLFRKSALSRVGFWSSDTVTEDIDISWKLQLNFWDIRYEPRALCWVLMPETLKGLWKQRLRWATGGGEAFFKYRHKIFNWTARRMWGVYIEFITSVIWSYSLLFLTVCWFLSFFIALPDWARGVSWIPDYHGVLLGLTCLIQFFISMMIDKRYDHNLMRHYFAIIFYPFCYWCLSWLTCICSFPQVLRRDRERRGRWVTTDRGIAR